MDQGRNIARQLKRNAGFTLLEILIVVAIIGLLLAIAVPSWISTRERARRDICIENLQQIETAKQLWVLETGLSETAHVDWSDLVGSGLYLRTMPTCPAGGEYFLPELMQDPVECSVDGHELEF